MQDTQDTLDITLDIKEIFKILWKKSIWIIMLTIIGGLFAFGTSRYMIAPQYTSSVSLYVNNTSESNPLSAVNINDINASQKLVNTYIVILQDDEVLGQVVSCLLKEYTQESLEKALPFSTVDGKKILKIETLRDKVLKMSAVNNTEVLKIEAETRNPVLSAKICTILTDVAPSVLKRVVKAGSVEMIGEAKPNDVPSSPNIRINTLIGLLFGFALSVGFVLLWSILDNTVKDEEDLRKRFNIPILGEIPDFSTVFKGGYGEDGN